ncbi:GAF domain-containing protein [Paracoccus sp. PAR01]|uniref:GAF domain-containing protein n=1 Tax=Paracoccus sp. PAR01 TaxID=2769282 RepID=UPI0017835D1E|nr:GAF domain-containing protein [Paracoccus sp. PAR01]MBD9526563.1 sigma-54-dependent Fis family transcriptional regulator [Paracoccus sp. PAR01]
MPEHRHEDRVAKASQSPGAVTRLAASWRRSMVKHGLDPAGAPSVRRLTPRELAERREALDGFINVARPQLDQLFQLVCPTGCSVLLTDASGIVLEQRVTEADAGVFRGWGLCNGADWSEAAEGTNGIGTCIIEGRQVTIHRDEHFYARNTGLSCMDAPIWGPDGRLIAALDVSSARTDTERWNGLIAAQVAQSARQIEAAFFRASFPGARIITAQPPGGDEAMLLIAVDKDDLAIGVNRAARRAFGLEKEGQLRPRPASDLFGREDEATGFEKAERAALIRALARAEGNVSAAARALGVGRATLYRRMSRLGISENPGRLSRS